jgi:hypothetical protein
VEENDYKAGLLNIIENECGIINIKGKPGKVK